MSWRLAKSLEKLRAQINEAAPNRSKASDGTIGDAKHASRSSDHNPWVTDAGKGVVTAIDITHDPRNGVDANALANALRTGKDTRIKYIIWNRQIWNPGVSPSWRAYKGANPHDKHMHLSVKSTKQHYDDDRPWIFDGLKPDAAAPIVEELPLLLPGTKGHPEFVERAKAALTAALKAEAGFGPLMEGLVKAFQAKNGMVVDGKIGTYTWSKLK